MNTCVQIIKVVLNKVKHLHSKIKRGVDFKRIRKSKEKEKEKGKAKRKLTCFYIIASVFSRRCESYMI